MGLLNTTYTLSPVSKPGFFCVWFSDREIISTFLLHAGIASTSYQFSGPNLLSLRGIVTGEIFGDEFWDVGLLYGRATTAQRYHASISAGVAVFGGRRSLGGFFSGSEKITRQVGIPIEGQLSWRPSGFIGLGLSGFANINEVRSVVGVAISLQLGKLR